MSFGKARHPDAETALVGMASGFIELANKADQFSRLLEGIGLTLIIQAVPRGGSPPSARMLLMPAVA